MSGHAHETLDPHTSPRASSGADASGGQRSAGLAARVPRWVVPAVLAGAVTIAVLLALGFSPTWIVLGGLFAGAHLFMHGGHGGHGAEGDRPAGTVRGDRRPDS